MVKPANCVICGLHETCKTYKQGFVSNAPGDVEAYGTDILLVGPGPTAEDDAAGHLLAHPDGIPYEEHPATYLEKWLSYWEGPWAYTTVVQCATPDGRDPKPSEVEACRVFLQREIKRTQPRVIIALGSVALKALWPEGPGSIVKAKGAPVKIGDYHLIVTYHPSMHVKGKQDLLGEYTRVFELATQIIEGKYRDESPDIREVVNKQDYAEMFRQVSRAREVTLDVENPTTKKDDDPSRYTFWMTDPAVICLGVGTTPDEPVWVMRRPWITPALLKVLAHKTIVGANVKHDITALAWDVWPQFLDELREHGGIEDTMLWHGSRDQSKWGNGLKEMAEQYLGVANWAWPVRQALDAERGRRVVARREWAKRQKAALKAGTPFYEPQPQWPTFADVDWPTLREYNGKDVYYTMRLLAYLREHLPPARAYREILLDGTLTAAMMELNGLGASEPVRAALEKAYTKKVKWLRDRLHEFPEIKRIVTRKGLKCIEGQDKTWFNPKSTPHKTALLDECNVDVTEKTKTGAPKTDKRVVAALVKEGFEVWRYAQALTQMRDRLSKFVVPMKYHIARDGRIHTTFKLMKVKSSSDDGADYSGGAESGRASTADPTIHNNIKDDVVRLMFEAARGNVLIEADHGQIEVRIAAWLCGCKKLIEMFESDVDAYILMASEIFKVSYKSLSKDSPERKVAKEGVLAKIYRQGAAGFAARSGLPLHEAVEFHERFDERFPELDEWQVHDLLRTARRGEVYTTVWGRQWTFDEMATDNEIVNRPVQSTASDLTLKQANHVPFLSPTVRLCNFTHDSLLFEVPEPQAMDIAAKVKVYMEDRSLLPIWIDCPLQVEVKVGRSLSGKHLKEVKL